jgi:tripartite-type tricarboxylate transporter receptor subunit TctC
LAADDRSHLPCAARSVPSDEIRNRESASKLPQPNSAFAKALHKPETEKRLAELGYAPLASSPEESTAQFRAMVQQWTAVVDKAKIKGE